MDNILTEEVAGITRRVLTRDFSGNTGLAIKNSIYQFMTGIAAKIGSLLFTIILARMLMPELFGLYSLALSTVVFLSAFSDLGIGSTLVRFIARELGKKKGNAKGYYSYLLNAKITLTLAVMIFLGVSSYFIAHFYYQKPIFLALIAGIFYIFSTQAIGFFSSVFQAQSKFKPNLYKEIIFQILRLIFVPLTILLAINYSTETLLFLIFIATSICYFITFIYLYVKRPTFYGTELKSPQKKEVNLFVLALTSTTISGIFFGYIDMIMLGRFVAPAFIGYYQAALSLVASASGIIAFSAVLFPIFSRLKGEQLKRGLRKSVFITLLASLAMVLISWILAPYLVLIVYGSNYVSSVLIFKLLSVLMILDPLISLYSTYHIARGNQNFVAKTLILATILNIILNYLFITLLLAVSPYAAVIGAGIATLISRSVYLLILFIYNSKN